MFLHRLSVFSNFEKLLRLAPILWSSFSRSLCPISRLRLCSSIFIICLSLFLAFGVLTNLSQSLLGTWLGLVTISTVSPFLRVYFSGTILPFTLAPTQRLPTSV